MTKSNGMTGKDALEALAYLVAIVGGISAAIIFFSNKRASSIENTRRVLVNEWTNEGDITSTETRFIDLKIENIDGDLVGTLKSPRIEETLDIAVDVGWNHTTLQITQIRGRSIIPVATAWIDVVGSNNRIKWLLTSSDNADFLPQSTMLWPVPKEAR